MITNWFKITYFLIILVFFYIKSLKLIRLYESVKYESKYLVINFLKIKLRGLIIIIKFEHFLTLKLILKYFNLTKLNQLLINYSKSKLKSIRYYFLAYLKLLATLKLKLN